MFAYCGNNPANRSDPAGTLWGCVIFAVCALILTGCSASDNVGAARPYTEVLGSDDPNAPNCYAYAIGSDSNMQPGDASGRKPTNYADVDDVAESVRQDLIALGYTVRPLNGPDDYISDNEYRIALRVGTTPDLCIYLQYGVLYYDYHFMVQTDTGCWAEKHGTTGDSIYWDNGKTPDKLEWTLHGHSYYDSSIRYFAVGS